MNRYVFFDLDDTLLDHSSASQVGAGILFERYPELSTGIERTEFLLRWPELTERHMDRFFAGEVDFGSQRRARMRELFSWVGRDLSDDEADSAFAVYVEGYEAAYCLFEDVAPCLSTLEQAGVPCGIITNGRVSAQRKKLERSGLVDRFATVLITEEIGVHKPDPAVFVEAARRAGRPIAECIYIGDKADTDARAATAAGMHGIWLDRHGRPALEEIHRITELDEVAAVLGL